MSLALDNELLLRLLLIATRIGAAVALTPIFGAAAIPARIRLVFVLALSACLSVLPTPAGAELPANSVALMSAVLAEVMIGAALGFGIHAAFGALALAGRLMDFQIGFAIGTTFDPATRTQGPLIGTFFTTLGVILFFATDAHLDLIRGLAYSFQIAPLGIWGLDAAPLVLIAQFGLMFVYGLAIAGPVIAGLMLVDIAIGVMARTMPQVNIYFVALPLKVFIGLLLLTLAFTAMGPVVNTVFKLMFQSWPQLLGAGTHG